MTLCEVDPSGVEVIFFKIQHLCVAPLRRRVGLCPLGETLTLFHSVLPPRSFPLFLY